ncbi:hypothetical protein [Pontibacter diazotrophicus]|uniref:hypothetical protein n=1 Tax=Pontibacter diazotrophicus TaxID=1400979 RepID=UPI0011C03DFE|nr:hypothetical protein [Pontibacter diazotrophicus]
MRRQNETPYRLQGQIPLQVPQSYHSHVFWYCADLRRVPIVAIQQRLARVIHPLVRRLFLYFISARAGVLRWMLPRSRHISYRQPPLYSHQTARSVQGKLQAPVPSQQLLPCRNRIQPFDETQKRVDKD